MHLGAMNSIELPSAIISLVSKSLHNQSLQTTPWRPGALRNRRIDMQALLHIIQRNERLHRLSFLLLEVFVQLLDDIGYQ